MCKLVKMGIMTTLLCLLITVPVSAEPNPEIELEPEKISMKRSASAWDYYYTPLDPDIVEGTWTMYSWFESYESTHANKYGRALYEDVHLPNGDKVEIIVESETELRFPQELQQYIAETVWTVTNSGYLISKTIVHEKDDHIGTGTMTTTISGRLDRVDPTSLHVDEATYFLNFFMDHVQDYVFKDSEFNRNRDLNTPGERVKMRAQYRYRFEKPVEEIAESSFAGELLNDFEKAWGRLKSALAGETFNVKVLTATAGVRG